MIGRTYLERGTPVTVLARWSTPGGGCWPPWLHWHTPCRLTAPRNVLIQRQDGSRVVRPFRGLRRTEP